ncbi:ABC transporter permease subunit [Micromonospora sp. NPDC004540]|uniref:ABC transporter permease subunit n=1 Tax=Micromonospora sp. NPDC004540 TaxID=3154457 RepID=UPI0033BCC1E9
MTGTGLIGRVRDAGAGVGPVGRQSPGWQVVAEQECRDLWWSGRGPGLVFAFSVVLSVMTYLAGTGQVLNFLEQREAVNLTLQVAVAVGVLVTLVVSADAISGERERGTLESLLLTPVSRRAIVVGKLAAALSLWLATFVVSVPYLWVLGRGVSLVGAALLLGLLVGTLLAVALALLGLLISAVGSSNKVSLAVSLFVLLALFAPTQLPGGTPKGWFGDLLVRLNPVDASLHYLAAVLVTGHTWTRDLSLLLSPLVTAVLAGGVLVAAGHRIVRLHGGVSGE